jgi:ATP-binding cassette subfamily B multidrug efflux pump
VSDEENEETPQHIPASETRVGPGAGRFSAAGMPTEKSKDFRKALRRLGQLLAPESLALAGVVVLAIGSVALVVIGPRVLGEATDIIFRGVITGQGIDTGELHSVLTTVAMLYLGSWALSYVQAYLLAGVVQRTMFVLRDNAESKLNRLPLSYVDKQARGDLLSRVTNDIDNIRR